MVRSQSDVSNPFVRWFFLTGDREWVAAILCVLFAASTAFLIAFDLIHVGPGSNLSTTLASGMLSGLLALLTVALSINQLILSKLFGSPGELSEELEGSLSYRRRVEEIAGVSGSPNEPGAFLTFLATTLKERVEEYRREIDRTTADVERYADGVTDFAERLMPAGKLADPFVVLCLTLGTEYATHIHRTRRLQSKTSGDLPGGAQEALDDIIELLKAVATMRQFFKTLVLQQELAMFSRHLIYSGVPAILVTYLLSLVYPADPSMTTAVDPAMLPTLVVVATAVILSPLAVLAAYLLRVATVSLYTVSIGTFVPPATSIENE